jgi:hypothetical protein
VLSSSVNIYSQGKKTAEREKMLERKKKQHMSMLLRIIDDDIKKNKQLSDADRIENFTNVKIQ